MRNPVVSNLLGLIGGAIGGVLGYVLFSWVVDQGVYGLMIPGALLGLGCSLLSGHRSVMRGLICGVAAVVLGMYSEWRHWPFVADKSFPFLISHYHEKQPITLLMTVLGGVFGFWMGKDAS